MLVLMSISYTRRTKSLCGGAPLHIKKSLDYKVLYNVSALEDEFETVWKEIDALRQKVKTILVSVPVNLLTLMPVSL